MDYGIVYFTIFAIIMIAIYQAKRISNRKTKEVLTNLESEFPKNFKIIGDVYFSKLHKLIDVDLRVLYSENDLLISGFDYYRDRQETFVFYNRKELKGLNKLSAPKYLISEVQIEENEKITLKSGDKIKIILNYKKYGKEKLPLKENQFDKLIRKLNRKVS